MHSKRLVAPVVLLVLAGCGGEPDQDRDAPARVQPAAALTADQARVLEGACERSRAAARAYWRFTRRRAPALERAFRNRSIAAIEREIAGFTTKARRSAGIIRKQRRALAVEWPAGARADLDRIDRAMRALADAHEQSAKAISSGDGAQLGAATRTLNRALDAKPQLTPEIADAAPACARRIGR